jgi:hypothetical protein
MNPMLHAYTTGLLKVRAIQDAFNPKLLPIPQYSFVQMFTVHRGVF